MVLIREYNKLTRDLSGLQNVEHGQPLRNRQSIIQLIVQNLSRYISFGHKQFSGMNEPSLEFSNSGNAEMDPIWHRSLGSPTVCRQSHARGKTVPQLTIDFE